MLNFVGLIGTNSKSQITEDSLQFMQKHFCRRATVAGEIDNIPILTEASKDEGSRNLFRAYKKIEATPTA